MPNVAFSESILLWRSERQRQMIKVQLMNLLIATSGPKIDRTGESSRPILAISLIPETMTQFSLSIRTPRSAGVAGQDYLRPAAVKAGVIPNGYKGRFGWHNLRHSLATFFAANDVNLPVIQSILRHAKPATTAVYMHRVNSAQMPAQGKFLDAINVKKAVL